MRRVRDAYDRLPEASTGEDVQLLAFNIDATDDLLSDDDCDANEDDEMQWPYMIKLNPFGVVLLLLLFLSLYLIYSSSSKTGALLKHIEAQHYERLRAMREPLPGTGASGAIGLEAQSIANRWPARRNSPIDDVLLKQELQLFQMVNLKEVLWAAVQIAQNGGDQVRLVRTEKASEMQRKDKGVHDPLTEGDMRSHRVMVQQMRQAFPGIQVISEENESKMTGLDDLAVHKLNKVRIPNELAWLPDRTVALTELIIWIDPLDATQEYTEDLLQYVTTMVCVAYKGRPIIGVVHKPFERVRSDRRRGKYEPARYETYWAWHSVGHSNSIEKLLHRRQSLRNESHLNVIVSRSHAGQVRSDVQRAFGDEYKTNIIQAGGSGYKTIELLKGIADVYMHNTLIKKWDICAPNAIVDEVSMGRSAAFTDLNGKTITYLPDHPVNTQGVFASIDQKHEQLIKKIQNLRS